MARKPPEKPMPKGKGAKARKDEGLDLSRGRATAPPPAGLDVMPRPFLVDEVREDGKSLVELEASPAERAALAEAYGLVDLAKLTARLHLKKRGSTIDVTGQLQARLTQTCVVSLEPFEVDLADPIERSYAPEAQVLAAWEELARLEAANSPDPIPDPPDQIIEGKINLGALVAESLALALDPYPRKPGVAFASPDDPSQGPDDSPFAVLARLKAGPPSTGST